MNKNGLWTRMVHAGEHREPLRGRPVATPIYATSAFTYDSMDEVESVFTGEGGDFIYTRHGNPTVTAFEDAMTEIEAGEASCAYASGMAALHARFSRAI